MTSHQDIYARLVAEQWRILREGRNWIILYVLATVGSYIYIDLYHYDANGLYVLIGLLVWAMGYILTISLLKNAGYIPDGLKSGVGTYFVLGIAIGLAILMAGVFFILPGMYLAMRWLPVFERALTSNDGAQGSMWWSWNSTEPVQFDLSRFSILPMLLIIVASLSPWVYDEFYDFFDWNGYVAYIVIYNLALQVGVAWFTVVGLAANAVLQGSDEAVQAEANLAA